MVNSNTVNSKFHLIQSYWKMFVYNCVNIPYLKCTVNSNFHLIWSKTLPTNDFELTVPDLYTLLGLNNTIATIYDITGGGHSCFSSQATTMGPECPECSNSIKSLNLDLVVRSKPMYLRCSFCKVVWTVQYSAHLSRGHTIVIEELQYFHIHTPQKVWNSNQKILLISWI